MRYIKIILLILMPLRFFAQQGPQFTQYMMNRYIYNPAFAGYEDYIEVKTGFKQQWLGLGVPSKTFYATANFAIDKEDRTSEGPTPYISKTIRRNFNPTAIRRKGEKGNFHQGVGIQLMSDQFGPLFDYSLAVTYAYHLPLGGEKKIAVGASVGFHQRLIDFNVGNFDAKDLNDNRLLSEGKLTGGHPLINVGAIYYTRTGYIGLSANQLIMQNVNYERLVKQAKADTVSWLGNVSPSFQLQSGITKRINSNLSLQPSILVKSTNFKNLVLEGNIKANFDDLFWVGASYRHKEAVAALFGIQISQASHLSYSYDFHFNGIFDRNYGSHEIVFGVNLNNKWTRR